MCKNISIVGLEPVKNSRLIGFSIHASDHFALKANFVIWRDLKNTSSAETIFIDQ
jgi:hypothetical protein